MRSVLARLAVRWLVRPSPIISRSTLYRRATRSPDNALMFQSRDRNKEGLMIVCIVNGHNRVLDSAITTFGTGRFHRLDQWGYA